MKVIYGLNKYKKSRRKTVVIIGIFDGVHRGHQTLISKAVQKAKSLKIPSIVLTFDPHPVQVLYPNRKLSLLIPLAYRLKLIESLGVDCTVVHPFSKKFSHLSPKAFIQKYLYRYLNPEIVFVGDDFRFGQNRSGSIEDFVKAGNEYGFDVSHIRPVEGDHEKISSSHIRSLILEGHLDKANFFLGRPVSIMGQVIKGDARGKSLGFPTANLLPQNEIIPPAGVYAIKVLYKNKTYHGAANIGTRPSFKRDGKTFLEAHIFNFNKTIYGDLIIIEFIKKIRNEKKFDSKEELILQIKKDVIKAKHILEKS
jgi:riboflavin kinase/FMN adenylyltransferase